MSELDEKDPLHEALQRRIREVEYQRLFANRVLQRMRRRRRLLGAAIVLAIGMISLGVYLLLFRSPNSLHIPAIGILGAAASVLAGMLTLAYLQPSNVARETGLSSENFVRMRAYIDEKLSDALEELKESDQKEIQFTENEKAAVLSAIQAKLESEALQSYVSGIRELMLGKIREESLDERFQSTRRRLGQEVQDLAKRGNLNLVLGILTTLCGLSILAYAVFTSPLSPTLQEMLGYFAPRISLVVLIEVFAYFFLRLYKQSLGEIKYFQNEITNVEAKHLALQVALLSEDLTLRSKLVEELAKTERNFILSKNQTTIDLERERMARSTYSDIAKAVKEAFKKKSDRFPKSQ